MGACQSGAIVGWRHDHVIEENTWPPIIRKDHDRKLQRCGCRCRHVTSCNFPAAKRSMRPQGGSMTAIVFSVEAVWGESLAVD
ncbi:hypothetical protein FKM82_015159 [Ascaphus truei]